MRRFELLGKDSDETRLLLESSTGYSVVLPGHPMIAPLSDGLPAYDVLVQLRDVAVELGFRIDDVPQTGMDPMAMARAFALSYANSRSVENPKGTLVHPMTEGNRPVNTVGGAHAVFNVRDQPAPLVEQIYVLIQPSPSGLWALNHTTRFLTSEIDVFGWAHIRGAIFDQHHWDPQFPRDQPTPVWPPESEFAICGARLDLTPEAWEEASSKGKAIGPLDPDHALLLVQTLFTFVQTNDPPRNRIQPMLFPVYMQRIAGIGPSYVAEAMLRNLERCLTTHDLRAWAWQCMWAIGRQDKLR